MTAPDDDGEEIELSSPACYLGEVGWGGAMTRQHYDDKETRDPGQREADLMARLPAQGAHAKSNAPYYAALYKDIDPRAVASRQALAALPLTRKSELSAQQ